MVNEVLLCGIMAAVSARFFKWLWRSEIPVTLERTLYKVLQVRQRYIQPLSARLSPTCTKVDVSALLLPAPTGYTMVYSEWSETWKSQQVSTQCAIKIIPVYHVYYIPFLLHSDLE